MLLVKPGKKLAKIMLVGQMVFTLLLALFFYLFFDLSKALSVAIGGIICILTSAIYTYFAFKVTGGSKYILIFKNVKSGRKAKLSMTVVLLLVCFQVPQIEKLELLLGYCLTVLMQYPITYFSYRAQAKA